MKPFNLAEYLKNPKRKVITRDGKKVRIICTDAKSVYPVIGLVDNGICGERLISCRKNGCESNDICESANDLFFVPEKHEGWINVYKWGDDYRYTGDVFSSKEKALNSITGCDNVATIKIEWEE